MRIVFLNVDRGRLKTELVSFIRQNIKNTDIFCFQEFDESITKLFTTEAFGFQTFSSLKNAVGQIYYNFMLVRDGLNVSQKGRLMDEDDNLGLADLFDITTGSYDFSLCNVHGTPSPANKSDTVQRLNQNNLILQKHIPMHLPTIIGGDFNLMPDTQSIRMFEVEGFRNLIKEYGIKATRTEDAWQRVVQKNKDWGLPIFEKQMYADYLFVSPDINVKSFTVSDINISDHLPLILEFEV